MIHYHEVILHPGALFFFFTDTATTEIYTLSLHDALPISGLSSATDARQPFPRRMPRTRASSVRMAPTRTPIPRMRSEEHTSELQSLAYLVCRLLLEKKKENQLQQAARQEWQYAKLAHL